MKARDLAENLPTVQPEDSAWDAARLIATHRLPGLAVVDPDGRPVAVLPASQVLRWVVPSYIQDDPSLARVFDEISAERLCVQRLAGELVGELLPPERHRVELAAVDGDATVLECAAVMARMRSPLLVVVENGEGSWSADSVAPARGVAPGRGRGVRASAGDHEVAQPHI